MQLFYQSESEMSREWARVYLNQSLVYLHCQIRMTYNLYTMEKVLKTIFKPQCAFCGKSGASFCGKCISKCSYIDIPRCIVCDRPSLEGKTHKNCRNDTTPTDIFSAFVYEGKVRECIKRAKFSPYEFDGLKDLARAAAVHSWRVGNFYENCLVVSVPLSKRRMKERGFNQTDIISKKLKNFYKIKFANKGITRKVPTKFLSEMTREERKLVLQNAFVADPAIFKGRDVLLIDDICTTGATLISCAKALKQAGAKNVRCFTIARVLK